MSTVTCTRRFWALTFLLSSVVSLALPLATPVLAQEKASVEESATVAGDDGRRSLRQWYEMGGWIMHGIVGCSILVFGLVLERAWAVRREAVIPAGLLAKLSAALHRREMPEIFTLCGGSSSSIARVLRAGLIHFDQGLGAMQEAVDTASGHEATLLRRNLPMLAALANVATMMGLLGTVLGMIESFDLIAKEGTGDASVVAGGIFQALVTTAFGLMVGISAVIFHSFLRRHVEVLESDLDELAFRMLEDLVLHRDAPPHTPRPEAAQLAPQKA